MGSVPLKDVPVNPLAALERYMVEHDYNVRCRSDAKTIVRKTGCVADIVPSCLAACHLAGAEAAYVGALPEVPSYAPAWLDEGSWMTVEDLIDAAARGGLGVVLLPPELLDDDEYEARYPFIVSSS